MKKYQNLLLATAILCLTSCAQPQQVNTCLQGHTYGFFGGLWHGLIAPFAFLVSLFNSHVSVWAVNNSGGWYSFGFLLGIGAFTSSAKEASK